MLLLFAKEKIILYLRAAETAHSLRSTRREKQLFSQMASEVCMLIPHQIPV